MRFMGAALPHASYFLSFSFQSARRSLLFRFERRVSSGVADQRAHQRVAAPEKGLAGHGSNDKSGAAIRPGTRSSA
jgi:hypothetical protein